MIGIKGQFSHRLSLFKKNMKNFINKYGKLIAKVTVAISALGYILKKMIELI
jgi:hypothetical protein